MMLSPAQVQEAHALLQKLQELDRHLEREVATSKTFTLLTRLGQSESYVTLSPTIRDAAFKAWRADVLTQRAAIHRRLAQLEINWKEQK